MTNEQLANQLKIYLDNKFTKLKEYLDDQDSLSKQDIQRYIDNENEKLRAQVKQHVDDKNESLRNEMFIKLNGVRNFLSKVIQSSKFIRERLEK